MFTTRISHLEMSDGAIMMKGMVWVASLRLHWPYNYTEQYILMSALALRFMDQMDNGGEKYFDCSENTLEKCNKIIKLQPSFIKVLQNFSSSAYGEIYKVGLSMFIDNPITGVGISNYQTICNNISKYKTMMINYDCASHPHNLYIQWLSEGCIITFASFLFLLLSILYFLFYGCNNKIFKYVSIACILILFWPIMSTGSLIKNWNGILTFYIIALCISLNRVKINK